MKEREKSIERERERGRNERQKKMAREAKKETKEMKEQERGLSGIRQKSCRGRRRRVVYPQGL